MRGITYVSTDALFWWTTSFGAFQEHLRKIFIEFSRAIICS